ncbi:MAG: UrcA family protein [Pseudomonadota bacterium]
MNQFVRRDEQFGHSTGAFEQGSELGSFGRLVKRSIAAVVIGGGLAVAPAAMAGDEYAITYAESELRSFSGIERVHQDIMRTARRYCPTYSQIRSHREVEACVADVANDLVNKVNHPRLTSFHVNEGSIDVAEVNERPGDRG